MTVDDIEDQQMMNQKLPKPHVCPCCQLSFTRAEFEPHLVAMKARIDATLESLTKPKAA